jgi:tetratricopeptide (TPR) repeat protein
MSLRHALPLLVAVAAGLSDTATLHAQTLANAATCDRAIRGSAADRVAITRLAARRTSATAHFAAGCLSVMDAKWDSARVQFDAAVSANPRSSVAYLWVGNIAGQQMRMTKEMTAKVALAPRIRDAYVKAIELDGANIDAREGLMQYLIDAPPPLGGDKAKAAEQAVAIGRLNPFRGLSAQIAVAAAQRDNAAVERHLTTATMQFPDSVLGWANLSAMQADANRPSEAFATITRWQARGRQLQFAQFSIGRTAAVTGQQLERGEAALKAYLSGPRSISDPPVANANFRLGQIYERQKRVTDARTAYQAALRANPSLRDAQMALDRLK